ncbi:MAG: hypothetical protein N2380_02065 [bacterium]|nr:hypothetical protein [bacterium]
MYLGVDYYPEHWEREMFDLVSNRFVKGKLELSPLGVMVLEA